MRFFSSRERSLERIAKHISRPFLAEEAEREASVRAIIEAVRQRDDEALVEFTRRWDWPDFTIGRVRVSTQEIEHAQSQVGPKLWSDLKRARRRIVRYHRQVRPHVPSEMIEPGARLGERFIPLERVGIYAPAGLPSSLLMAVGPAQVAGVQEIAVCTPPQRDGTVSSATLAAAGVCGLTEVYRLGGAQAIAALTLGTASVRRADKVVGPGNIYVTLAKKQFYGAVGIDGLYGPSEVVIIADESAKSKLVAADLLAQGEHGPGFLGVLITTSGTLRQAVAAAVQEQMAELPHAVQMREWFAAGAALVLVRNLEEAATLSNSLAPEHLELMIARPRRLLPKIRHAGAIFLGSASPVAVGDYYAGPSHILPTGRTARFSSGLGVEDFLKRSHIIRTSRAWLSEHGPAIKCLARSEGLEAHARAVEKRIQ